MAKNIVTFNSLGRAGRFANALYQIASTIGIARKNGFDFAFPPFMNYDHRDRFASQEDIDLQKHFVNPLPVYDGPELPDYNVPWGYHDVVLTESVSLFGHLQSPRYFEHCMGEVRHYFRMKDEPPQNDYTAIHWRSEDYSTEAGYHPRLTMDYYAPAMEQTGGELLVFSDDIAGARNLFGSSVEYSEGRDYIADFKLLKRCKSFIIGNSSYSAMAAVLGEHPEKRVIAPRPWFGPKYTEIDGEDIYDKGWTVINWQNAREAAA